ncbi:uncharacterized protein PAC_10021 [Phialocephala subalpina]|uniref:Uncharacterized protein n=1 Tax=Phialocephala subalpina TaxID=576137 RepID=A0A1L7X548_9HELO|nr:uncharacterized protein PAC_10021 [Phialocephala subalpina]
MPPKQAAGPSPSAPSAKPEVQPKDKSDYQYLKEGGWKDMNHFMLSYNLRMYKDDDVQEAKSILKAFKEGDQYQWEERQKEKAQKSDYSIVKEGGYGNMKNFAESHGLRLHNGEDVQEAKAILDVFREYDRRAWEEQQKK